jgi:hypothetical protein
MEILSVVAIVLSIIAISRSNDVSLKIAKLEKKFEGKDTLTSQVIHSSVGENISRGVVEAGLPESVDIKDVPIVVEGNKESGFVTWLKEDWLLKLGGTLVLMGVLFFLSIGFAAVGPQGKVIMGYIFGVSLMVFGFKYAKKQLIGGSTIHVIGAVIILITTYLARSSYNLFDPYFATLLMFLTTVCVALTAFLYERKELAHVGLFLAAIVPMLTNTESNSFSQLLLYLGIVTLGVMWLALVTKWRTLVLLALSIVCVYSLIKLGSLGSGKISFTESYLLVVFGILFYVTSLFSILRSRGVTQLADGAVAVLNAGFGLTWIITQMPHEIAPIIIALISLIYAAGFFFVYKVTDVYTSFIVYGGVALGLLTTAIMLQLSGRSETVALLLIGTGVTLFTYYLSSDEKVTKVVALFNVIPLLYVLKSLSMITLGTFAHQGNEAWKDIIVVVLAIVIYFSLYGYFVSRVKKLWQVSLFAAFSLSVLAIWQILHLVIGGGFATFMSILAYTIIGLTVLFQGVQEKNGTKISLAKTWMGLVAARVIFWDAWQVGDVILGVLICIVIGILLLSSTFILRKVTTE